MTELEYNQKANLGRFLAIAIIKGLQDAGMQELINQVQESGFKLVLQEQGAQHIDIYNEESFYETMAQIAFQPNIIPLTDGEFFGFKYIKEEEKEDEK